MERNEFKRSFVEELAKQEVAERGNEGWESRERQTFRGGGGRQRETEARVESEQRLGSA